MIVYYLFVHKKSVWKRKVCIIFIKIIKFKKNQKKTFLVGFFRWCSVPVELFYIERGCNSSSEIWERETRCNLHAHGCIWCKDKFVFSPLLALPLPLSLLPPYKCDKGEPAYVYFRPPPPHTPEDYSQFLAASAKIEDGLHLEACEYCSWIWTAIVIMYEFSVQW